jgi:hypothetical protein
MGTADESIERLVSDANTLSQEKRHDDALQLVDEAIDLAEKGVKQCRDAMELSKSKHLLLVRVLEAGAQVAMNAGMDDQMRVYCDRGLAIVERYIYAGDMSLKEEALLLYVKRDGVDRVADSAWENDSSRKVDAELDVASSDFTKGMFQSAYRHLATAEPLLKDAATFCQMQEGELVNCRVRMLEILAIDALPEQALSFGVPLVRWIQERMTEGRTQYARFFYKCWFYNAYAAMRAGQAEQAVPDAQNCLNALRRDIETNLRDDLVPLLGSLEAAVKESIMGNRTAK